MASIIVSGDIYYNMPIKCYACKKGVYVKHSVRIVHCELELMENLIQTDFNFTVPNIPVGWAMYGRDRIYCETCKPT